MKISLFTLALLVPIAVYGGEGNGPENQPPDYSIAERGAHYRVWQKVVSHTNALGQSITRTNRAVLELATGMHYQRDGQWIESKEEVVSISSGGAATNGPHTVIFATDVHSAVVIDMQTPDGKRLQSRVLGLSYFDASSGSNVLIAEIKSSQGVILPPNRVLYEDAFTDFRADVLYTYTRAGFEQDVVLRERPPTPEVFGLSSTSSVLQVLTEFIAPPQPVASTNVIPSGAGGFFADQFLDFGTMKIGVGKAFTVGQSQLGGIPVAKEWATLEGRTFLVEQVSVLAITGQLNELPLPPQARLKLAPDSALHVVSNRRLLPERKAARGSNGSMSVAKASQPSRGFVLDYEILDISQTNYTYQGDTTYYISGLFTSAGTNTFEGGAVLKFATNGSIQVIPAGSISPRMNWQAGAYRPVVFTAKDDNTVGESITNSTGNPTTNYYGNPMLYIAAPAASPTLTGLRISCAREGLRVSAGTYNIYNAQFIHCQKGLVVSGGATALLGNALFASAQTNVEVSSGSTLNAQNVTFSSSDYLAAGSTDPDSSIALTNCILANATNLFCGTFSSTNGNYNGFYNSPYDSKLGAIAPTNASDPFQTVGGGSHYLSENCNFRNSGITNINSAVLADLKIRTTYPPILYNIPGAFFSTSLELFPQAQRDTDAPDLGYHYDPLDYVAGGMFITNATITVQAGTAVGMYGTNGLHYGMGIAFNAQFFSQGTADNLIRIVEYNTVQEQGPTGWEIPSVALVTSVWDNSSVVHPCRFTDWSVMAQDAAHVQFSGDIGPINFQDCQFHGGQLPSAYTTYNFTNCLLERVNADLESWDTLTPIIRNNLFWGGTFRFVPEVTDSIIKDNLFDQTTIPNSIIEGSGAYDGGFNAFVTNRNRLQPTNANDVILIASPGYQIGPLGKFYYPTNLSALINAGSANATFTGLYHFTTTTNQVKETNSVVDIGFHYTSIGQISTITPADDDDDGIPDYLEDYNGNGAVNSGETDWQSATDMGLKVWITRPRNGSTLP